MKRILFAGLMALAIGCGSTGGNWTCSWECQTNGASGTKTYPRGPDPTDQCVTDYRAGCNSFTCNCTQ